MVVTPFTGGRGPEFVEDPDHLLFLMPVMIVGWSDHPKSTAIWAKMECTVNALNIAFAY